MLFLRARLLSCCSKSLFLWGAHSFSRLDACFLPLLCPLVLDLKYLPTCQRRKTVHGALAHVNAQFQQFASNALSPPEPIILGHLSDQGDRFGGDLGLARKDLGLTLPIPTKELPMPAEQGLWLDNEQGLVPASNQPC